MTERMALKTQLESRASRPTAGEEDAFHTILDALAPWTHALTRLSVRSDDVIDAQGKSEHVFRVHVTFSGKRGEAPSLLVEGRGYQERAAARGAARAAVVAVRRILEGEATAKQESVSGVVRVPHRTPRSRKSANPPRGRGFHKTSIEASVSHAAEARGPGKRPSRKSTRRSENRVKPDSQLRRQAVRAVRSPKSRATNDMV